MAAYENWIVELALTSQPDAPFPTWTNITAWVESIDTTHGRDSEDADVQPARLTAVLNNADHRFTPGNTTSPYYPNVKQARRIRVREVIGPRGFDIFNGGVETLEIGDWAESGDQLVTVTATDRLARLARGRKFLGVLAEHIVYTGGTTLKAYYPMNDLTMPFADVRGGYTSLPVYSSPGAAPVSGNTGTPAVTLGSVQIAPADDTPSVAYSVMTNGVTSVNAAFGTDTDLSTSISLAAGQVLTAVVWAQPNVVAPSDLQIPLRLTLANSGGAFSSPLLSLYCAGGTWQFSITNTSTDLGGTLSSGSPYNSAASVPVAIRYGYSPSVFELWIGSQVFLGTLSGSAPTSAQLFHISAPVPGYSGAIGHLQIYVGSATDYTNAMFLTQMAMGWTGLAGQTTGQRIRTLAAYAGLATAELDVGDGVSPMRAATLAGRSPLDPMRDAETTEQGLLLASPSGQLTFRDRRRRYNI